MVKRLIENGVDDVVDQNGLTPLESFIDKCMIDLNMIKF